jgi:hypothetical protein
MLYLYFSTENNFLFLVVLPRRNEVLHFLYMRKVGKIAIIEQ